MNSPEASVRGAAAAARRLSQVVVPQVFSTAAPRLRSLALCALVASSCAREEVGAPPPDEPGVLPPKVFDTSRLHEISIEVEAEHLRLLADQAKQRVPCTFTFDGTTLADVGIRRKGGAGSTRPLDDKPGFNVDLDEFRPGQELDGVDKLLLNNAVQDPSFLSEHLGYELHRRAGVPAPRTAHAVVRFNGEVYGIYVVKEAIDREFLRRHFDGHDGGNLYEGCCADDFAYMPWIPELEHEAEENRSRADLEEFARFIDAATDDGFAAQLPGWLDVDRFLTAWAVEVLTAHWDGFIFNNNNFYMYHHPEDGRFVFLPHGMDQLFQEACFDPLEPPAARLARRMSRIPAFAARLRDEMIRVAGEPSDPVALSRYVQAVTDAMHAVEIDDERFENDHASYDAQVEATLETLAFRRRMLAGLDAVCGDGVVGGPELCGCDDGNVVPGDGCNERCGVEYCGDGIVQGAEACDGEGCSVTCTGPAVCGDGTEDPGEECDDGNTEPFDGCDACRLGCLGDARDGRRYAFCLQTVEAQEARSICDGLGGALVVPEDVAENAWLSSRADDAGSSDFWVGVSDAAQEGTWRTFDGAPASYLPWSERAPDGASEENCAASESWRGGRWNDKPCDEAFAFVCRFP